MSKKEQTEVMNTDIGQEVQNLIGAQTMQIITLNKKVQELEAILNVFEKENKELKSKVK